MRSNTYTLLFTSSVTIILGFLLSIASTSLKEAQEMNIAVDIKRNILRSLNIPEDKTRKLSPDEVQSMFNRYIEGSVVDADGNIAEGVKPEDLTEGDETYYPVYTKKVNNEIKGYAIPISGKGLWSTIYGYIALEPDGNTVQGITFYKHGETPGLGGEIEKEWFTGNFVGKNIFNETGDLVSVKVIKGKVNPSDSNYKHQVDGISGATMTGKGLNIFLKNELKKYEPFLRNLLSKKAI